MPGVNGNAGFSWYCPEIKRRSAKLIPAACTAMRTAPSLMAGEGIFSTTSFSGPPHSLHSTARMKVSFGRSDIVIEARHVRRSFANPDHQLSSHVSGFAQAMSFRNLLHSENFFYHRTNFSRLDQCTDLFKFAASRLDPRDQQSFAAHQSAHNAARKPGNRRGKKLQPPRRFVGNRRSQSNQSTSNLQRAK